MFLVFSTRWDISVAVYDRKNETFNIVVLLWHEQVQTEFLDRLALNLISQGAYLSRKCWNMFWLLAKHYPWNCFHGLKSENRKDVKKDIKPIALKFVGHVIITLSYFMFFLIRDSYTLTPFCRNNFKLISSIQRNSLSLSLSLLEIKCFVGSIPSHKKTTQVCTVHMAV